MTCADSASYQSCSSGAIRSGEHRSIRELRESLRERIRMCELELEFLKLRIAIDDAIRELARIETRSRIAVWQQLVEVPARSRETTDRAKFERATSSGERMRATRFRLPRVSMNALAIALPLQRIYAHCVFFEVGGTSSFILDSLHSHRRDGWCLEHDVAPAVGPHSDSGWGGGSLPCNIVDGRRAYDRWAHRFDFTGGCDEGCVGPSWIEPAGIRHAAIDFVSSCAFHKIVLRWHGVERKRDTGTMEYWEDTQPVFAFGSMQTESAGSDCCGSDFCTFCRSARGRTKCSGQNVVGTYSLHGWLYDVEGFDEHFRAGCRQTSRIPLSLRAHSPGTSVHRSSERFDAGLYFAARNRAVDCVWNANRHRSSEYGRPPAAEGAVCVREWRDQRCLRQRQRSVRAGPLGRVSAVTISLRRTSARHSPARELALETNCPRWMRVFGPRVPRIDDWVAEHSRLNLSDPRRRDRYAPAS